MVENGQGKISFPSQYDFTEPIWRILKERGGASSRELMEKAAEDMGLTEEQIGLLHKDSRTRTKLHYCCSWAMTFLKKAGYSTNPSHGIWVNTVEGNELEEFDMAVFRKRVRDYDRKKKSEEKVPDDSESDEESPSGDDLFDDEYAWIDELISTIMEITPTAFEKLCRRLLLEIGFEQVEVTKQSSDGGIDGIGELRTKDVFTQIVAFQSKRYKPGNNISTGQVREFRGSIQGLTNMGVLITTSSFTKAARKEASRSGAIWINLLDGEELCHLLKKYEIGVNKTTVEEVSVEKDFFKSLE